MSGCFAFHPVARLARHWFFCVSLLIGLPCASAHAQTGTDSAGRYSQPQFNQTRLTTLLAGGAVAYGATLAGLHYLWYAGTPRTGFRFFNDNAEWKQMDKVGHFYSAYHLSRMGVRAFEWTGLPRRKAILWGGLTGVLFQTPIEILDGFSASYGASWGDLIANTAGTGLLAWQLLVWDKERIHPKFSFWPTSLAASRPNVLGSTLLQQLLKDYNGQTYWLALEVKPWLRPESHFPAWLCVSAGYGASGMVFAQDAANKAAGTTAYRQYYLSLDVDFTKIRTRNRFVRSLFYLLNAVRLPAPALEWSRPHGFRFHSISL